MPQWGRTESGLPPYPRTSTEAWAPTSWFVFSEVIQDQSLEWPFGDTSVSDFLHIYYLLFANFGQRGRAPLLSLGQFGLTENCGPGSEYAETTRLALVRHSASLQPFTF